MLDPEDKITQQEDNVFLNSSESFVSDSAELWLGIHIQEKTSSILFKHRQNIAPSNVKQECGSQLLFFQSK